MAVPSTISDLSTTAASNSPQGSDSIGTTLDDFLRAIQAIQRTTFNDQRDSKTQWLTGVSGADTITATAASPAPTAYQAGQTFRFVSAGANTTAVTLNVSSLGAKSVVKPGGSALIAGDIPSGATVTVTYDGTNFVLVGLAIPSSLVDGTTTNDSAAAGKIGEYKVSNIVSGSAVALTNGVVANVTSLSLEAGEWEVDGFVSFSYGATTSFTSWAGSVSSTSATHEPTTTSTHRCAAFVPASGNVAIPTGRLRLSLSGTTTVYLTASAAFTVSTASAFGILRARRPR